MAGAHWMSDIMVGGTFKPKSGYIDDKRTASPINIVGLALFK
jgi:hypothetical protein